MTASTPARYLDLIQQLNDEHQARAGASGLSVVPVVVDDLDQALAVGRCLTSLIGGAVLGDEPVDAFLPRPGHDHAPVRAAVEAALDITYPLVRRRVLVEVAPALHGADTQAVGGLGAGEFRLSYVTDSAAGGPGAPATAGAPATPPFGSLSGGEQAMLGLAVSLLDQLLVAGELAVVLYDESGMDTQSSQACWSLLVDHLPGMSLGPLRTLVAFVGAAPRVSIHAVPQRGCRYAIVDNRLLQRKPYDNACGDALAFATRAATPRVLFLGAGFSMSSQLPMGNGLRDSAIRRLLGELSPASAVDGSDLVRRFRDWLVADGRLAAPLQGLTEAEFVEHLTLEQVLAVETLVYPDLPTLDDFAEIHARAVASPGAAVLSLAAMLRVPHDLVLVTVNFDELVEAHAPDLVTPFATDEDFVEAGAYVTRYLAGEDLAVPLLKLHGTLSEPESCIVTTTQTEQGISLQRQAALRALLPADPTARVPWAYVGASMRDIDLNPTLRDPSFARALDERWVAPFLDPAVEAFAEARRPFWGSDDSLQAHLVTEIADEFLRLLLDRWPTE